jgi:hypothetical protein
MNNFRTIWCYFQIILVYIEKKQILGPILLHD